MLGVEAWQLGEVWLMGAQFCLIPQLPILTVARMAEPASVVPKGCMEFPPVAVSFML